MPNSTVPAVKAALLAAIRAELPEVQVEWAHPGNLILKESVFMGDASGEETAAILADPAVASRTRDENYIVPVVVSVLSEGDDAQAAEERMWTLVTSVEDAVRADMTLGAVTGLVWAQVTGKEPRLYIEAGARVAECVVLVSCRARI